MMVKVFDGLGLVTSANSTKTELLGMQGSDSVSS